MDHNQTQSCCPILHGKSPKEEDSVVQVTQFTLLHYQHQPYLMMAIDEILVDTIADCVMSKMDQQSHVNCLYQIFSIYLCILMN